MFCIAPILLAMAPVTIRSGRLLDLRNTCFGGPKHRNVFLGSSGGCTKWSQQWEIGFDSMHLASEWGKHPDNRKQDWYELICTRKVCNIIGSQLWPGTLVGHSAKHETQEQPMDPLAFRGETFACCHDHYTSAKLLVGDFHHSAATQHREVFRALKVEILMVQMAGKAQNR